MNSRSPAHQWNRMAVGITVFVGVSALLVSCSTADDPVADRPDPIFGPRTNALLVLPPDAEADVPVSGHPPCNLVDADTFASWFESGTPSVNGVVRHPHRTNEFEPRGNIDAPKSNCDFYKEALHTFLWVTSPAPEEIGPGKYIFDTDAFFSVSPRDREGRRRFIPHPINTLDYQIRDQQHGPHNLPVVEDSKGAFWEVEPVVLGPNRKPLVKDVSGKEREVGGIIITPPKDGAPAKDRKPTFYDLSGAVIQGARPLTRAGLENERILQRFNLEDGSYIYITMYGDVVDALPEQADNGILMARNGSLVYYTTIVNDAYAYYHLAAGGNYDRERGFPKDLDELARTPRPRHPPVLVLMLKMAWVEATGLDLNSYITTIGRIPEYDTRNPRRWRPTGRTRRARLALVGMHVVGTRNDHQEMIWATFEHFQNTPLETYEYLTRRGTNRVERSAAQTWLFCRRGASTFNVKHMIFNASHEIEARVDRISPSDTIRSKPFGAGTNYAPNPSVHSAADSNSQVISINRSVLSQLIPGDVRANYYLVGATWTNYDGNRLPPRGPYGGDTRLLGQGTEVGTSKLANAVMETYQQGDANSNTGANCFLCHGFSNLSHMFREINPLEPRAR